MGEEIFEATSQLQGNQRIRHQALLSTEFESLAARGRSATGTGGRTTRISYEDQERGAPQVGSGFSRPNGLPERSLTEEIHLLLGRSRGLERGPVKSSTRGLPTTAPRLSTPPAPLATVRVSRSAVFASPAPQRSFSGSGEQQPSAPQRPSTGSGRQESIARSQHLFRSAGGQEAGGQEPVYRRKSLSRYRVCFRVP